MNRVGLKKIFFEYWLSIVVLFSILFFIIKPLLHDGFFPTFDDVQVVRVDQMARELLSGQFPVRFVNDLGNGGGYNLFSFYPPFVYYLGSLIHLIGIPLVKTVKITFILGFVLAGAGMFTLLKHFFSKRLATIGAGLLLASPFLSYEVFIRGAMAEFFGMAFFPITLWLFIKLIEEKRLVYFLLFGVSFAFLILSHTFVGIFAAAFFVLVILLMKKPKRSIALPFLGIVLGIILTTWFWLPVLFQQGLTQYSHSFFATQSFSSNFLTPFQIFGINPPKWDFLPPLLGLTLSFAAILGIGVGINEKIYKKSAIFNLSLIGFIVCLFFISSGSRFIWQSSIQLQYMQFPWRFLVFLTISSVILAVFFLDNIKNKFFQVVIGTGLVLVSLFLYSSYFHPKTYNYISEYFAEDTCGTTTWAQEYLPIEVGKCLPRSKTHEFTYPMVVGSKDTQVKAVESRHGREIEINTTGKSGVVSARKYFSPGWEATLDGGKRLSLFASKPYGLVSFNVPEGNHRVIVSLQKTETEKVSEYVTIIGALLSLASFFAFRTHIIKKRK